MAYALLLLSVAGTSLQAGETLVEPMAGKLVQHDRIEQQSKSGIDCVSVSMDELVEGLKESKAIGFFTKLAIRSDVIGFRDNVKKIRKKNQLKDKMKSVKANFDGLLLKIMTLLEKDPNLSKKIYLGRHSIFKSLLEVQG